ncbi:AAA family ATPase [Thioflexithrix psekupsensis]|uniref:Endonuclease GajA/Old nuclease/RecF-like AAA domain-containing protein n=1 Tax=Thioflexithrix psekupsensis TaxID=1570016 RepID=A0A251XCQ3_9GAMM|nr:ATP-binding protein [Thioflexithrix psekupsensis]OUD16035.1 hypothetical protein TPSD3_01125 [Thioflexithrix psekupsensis]
MYDSIGIKNFRAFNNLHVKNLKPVNLFVGKNNAGKTSILEAIELLSSNGNALLKILERRQENSDVATEEQLAQVSFGIRHLFNGHRLEENLQFEISGQWKNKKRLLQFHIVPAEFTQDLFNFDKSEELLALLLESSELERKMYIPLSSDKSLLNGLLRASANHSIPTLFLGTRDIDSRELNKLWDSILFTPKEEKVYEALRSISPTIERIAFTTTTGRFSNGIIVKLQNANRVPLGSMGDGMRRLLGIAIALVNSENGILLVDEIDTGLHYSAMEDMWRFVIQTANLFNIQVFATTHSWDCVYALAGLHQEQPFISASVALHRVDVTESKTVCYSTEELEIATRHHIEVRG